MFISLVRFKYKPLKNALQAALENERLIFPKRSNHVLVPPMSMTELNRGVRQRSGGIEYEDMDIVKG